MIAKFANGFHPEKFVIKTLFLHGLNDHTAAECIKDLVGKMQA